MKPHLLSAIVLLLGVAATSQALAGDVCEEAKTDLVGRTFVAKMGLYDTKVAVDGIRRLEWDKEMIPEGAEFEVIKVLCNSKRIYLQLREIADRKPRKVEIYFLIRASDRLGDEGQKNLEKCMSFVFESPENESGE